MASGGHPNDFRGSSEWISDLPSGGRDDLVEDVHQDLAGQADGVDVGDERVVIEIKYGTGFFVVHIDAAANDRFVGIVGAARVNRPLLNPGDQSIGIRAGEVYDPQYVDVLVDHARLPGASGDAVENEQVGVGSVTVRIDEALNVLPPQADRQVVWDEQALR